MLLKRYNNISVLLTALFLFSCLAFFTACKGKNISKEEKPFQLTPQLKESDLLKNNKVTKRKITSRDSKVYTMEYFNECGLLTKEVTYFKDNYTQVRQLKYEAGQKLIEDWMVENNLLIYKTTYRYNKGLLISETSYHGKNGPGERLDYIYDSNNRLCSKTGRDSVIEYSYDEHGLLSLESLSDLAPGETTIGLTKKNTCTTYYTYNNKGWMVSSWFNDSMLGMVSNEFDYDEEGRYVEKRSSMGMMGMKTVATYTYNEMGLVEKVVYKKSGSATDIKRYEYLFD